MKLIVRIKGGLGNQLFCYAAARRLAFVSNAELIIDDITGFVQDYTYQRKYSLNNFRITARKASPYERYQRVIKKALSYIQPYEFRSYITQEGIDFDQRIIDLRVKKNVYMDGLWQSEKYFIDIEQLIREELTFHPPSDKLNNHIASKINQSNSIAIHVRLFEHYKKNSIINASLEYYKNAISYIEDQISTPHYFLFSDDMEFARSFIPISNERITCISHNKGDELAYADLWLMRQCKHFIIANSTFSWWGAWLSEDNSQITIVPNITISGITAWNFKGLIPDRWIKM